MKFKGSNIAVAVVLSFVAAIAIDGIVHAQASWTPVDRLRAKVLRVTHSASITNATVPSLKFTPTDTEPTATEGTIYYNESAEKITLRTSGAWVALVTGGGSGDNTLDLAYDEGGSGAGKKIVVDSGAVEFEVGDGDNNPALHIDANDVTNDPTAFLIENAADATNAITIDIDGQGTGRDIEGSGATWHVTGLGVMTVTDLQTATATVSGAFVTDSLVMENGGEVGNDTPNEIEFRENSEEFSFVFNGNTLTYATDTDINAIDMGVVDDLIGVGSIAMDQAAASISLAANGAADDFTIAVTGAQNSSLILASAGTAADALQITSSAGGIDITNGGAAGGEDIDIVSTSASVNITAGEAVNDSFSVQLSGGVDLDAVDDIILTLASTGAADDFRIIQTGAVNASISLEAAGTGTDAIRLQASAGGVDIDAVDDLNITVASSAGDDDLNIVQTGAFDASISLQAAGTGTDAVSIQASAGGVDIDAVDDLNIAVASSAGDDDLVIAQTGAFDASILLQAAGTGADAIGLTASAAGITLTAATTITMASATTFSSTLDIGDGDFELNSVAVDATAAQLNTITIDPGAHGMGSIDFNATGTGAMTITINSVAYLEAGSEDLPNGIWTNGANPGDSATSLILAINGDTRTSIAYTALADESGDGVILIADNIGTAGNFTLASDDGAATVSAGTMLHGAAAALKQQATYEHTVNATDDLAGNIDVPLPFAPIGYQVQVRSTTGLLKAITALVTVETTPNRLRIDYDGGTNPAATDELFVLAWN